MFSSELCWQRGISKLSYSITPSARKQSSLFALSLSRRVERDPAILHLKSAILRTPFLTFSTPVGNQWRKGDNVSLLTRTRARMFVPVAGKIRFSPSKNSIPDAREVAFPSTDNSSSEVGHSVESRRTASNRAETRAKIRVPESAPGTAHTIE